MTGWESECVCVCAFVGCVVCVFSCISEWKRAKCEISKNVREWMMKIMMMMMLGAFLLFSNIIEECVWVNFVFCGMCSFSTLYYCCANCVLLLSRYFRTVLASEYCSRAYIKWICEISRVLCFVCGTLLSIFVSHLHNMWELFEKFDKCCVFFVYFLLLMFGRCYNWENVFASVCGGGGGGGCPDYTYMFFYV